MSDKRTGMKPKKATKQETTEVAPVPAKDAGRRPSGRAAAL